MADPVTGIVRTRGAVIVFTVNSHVVLLLRTPDGIPDGWCVSVGTDGVTILERKRGA